MMHHLNLDVVIPQTKHPIRLQGHPLFCKLSAVKILLCNKVQAKKRHFGSVFAFQMGLDLILQKFVEN
jgi:hypothetical protein